MFEDAGELAEGEVDDMAAPREAMPIDETSPGERRPSCRNHIRSIRSVRSV